jgi:hypothetical protein
MSEYKKKPLLYKLNEFYEDHFCTYNRRFIPFQWLRNFKYWFKYTFISPVNVVKIRTLRKGPWVDRDEILLHAAFQVLVDFVEKECSGPYNRLEPINIESEMDGCKDWSEDDKKSHRECFESQNNSNKEIKDLYDWWTIKRPIRQKSDPFTLEDKDYDLEWEPSKEDNIASRDEYGDPLTYHFNLKPDAERSAYYDRQNVYETMSDKEDEDMIIRLMKIRKHLWT